MIEVKGINKSFKENGSYRQVLYDINAKFYDGKTNLIIGQSGSGKTVLVKNIVGLFKPDDGQILYDGRDASNSRSCARKSGCSSRGRHSSTARRCWAT